MQDAIQVSAARPPIGSGRDRPAPHPNRTRRTFAAGIHPSTYRRPARTRNGDRALRPRRRPQCGIRSVRTCSATVGTDAGNSSPLPLTPCDVDIGPSSAMYVPEESMALYAPIRLGRSVAIEIRSTFDRGQPGRHQNRPKDALRYERRIVLHEAEEITNLRDPGDGSCPPSVRRSASTSQEL
jgi:hypothetical protein